VSNITMLNYTHFAKTSVFLEQYPTMKITFS